MTDDALSQQLNKKLALLSRAMRQAQLWQHHRPPEEALQSRLPFGCDRLSFANWLQFVFIPTIEQLQQANQPLPDRCGLQPMAQQSWTLQGAILDVYQLLGEIDRLLSKESV